MRVAVEGYRWGEEVKVGSRIRSGGMKPRGMYGYVEHECGEFRDVSFCLSFTDVKVKDLVLRYVVRRNHCTATGQT